MGVAPKPPPPPARRGVIASAEGAARTARETWSIAGPPGDRRFSAKGELGGEENLAWSIAAGFGATGDCVSFDLQAFPRSRPSEVTTSAFRCYGGRAYGTTIGPGGIPEKTETTFPPGSAFRGFSFALESFVAASVPLRVGHGRRLVVIEVDTDDLRPRVRDWMLLAVSKERAGDAAGARWALAYEFRPADAPGRALSSLTATAEGALLAASRSVPGGLLEVRPLSGAP